MCKVFLGWDLISKITILADLISVIESLCDGFDVKNPLVRFVHSNGNMLWMGYSVEGCHLNYQDASLNPPYYSSFNPSLSEDKSIVVFTMSYEEHLVEVYKSALVDFESFKKVAEYFFNEGERPEKIIAWKTD